MGELLPVFLGCLIGIGAGFLRPRRRAVVPAACIAAGALASAVNGELDEALWGLFVSFDAALVWLGAAVTAGLVWSWRRLSAAA
jgi:hypothetical protein